MPQRVLAAVAFAALLAVLSTGCQVALQSYREGVMTLRHQIHTARATGAVVCAPQDLAKAQTSYRFAAFELERGNLGRASDHLQVGTEAAQAAIMAGARCETKGLPVADPEADPWLDPDADQVPDEVDACPYVMEDFDGFEDGDGCPEWDNDQDGLLDAEDECPIVAEDLDGFEDGDGCPDFDDDGDEVPDDQDACPTMKETKNDWEDADGCPDMAPLRRFDIVGMKIVFKEPISFRRYSDVLLPENLPKLDELGLLLNFWVDWYIRIDGYSDSHGRAGYLQRLSETMAGRVKEALVERGVAENRIQVVGHGPGEAQATDPTGFGLGASRRIEIEIVKGSAVEYVATQTYEALIKQGAYAPPPPAPEAPTGAGEGAVGEPPP